MPNAKTTPSAARPPMIDAIVALTKPRTPSGSSILAATSIPWLRTPVYRPRVEPTFLPLGPPFRRFRGARGTPDNPGASAGQAGRRPRRLAVLKPLAHATPFGELLARKALLCAAVHHDRDDRAVR